MVRPFLQFHQWMTSTDQREQLDKRQWTLDPRLASYFIGQLNWDLMIWYNLVVGDMQSPVMLPNCDELKFDLEEKETVG